MEIGKSTLPYNQSVEKKILLEDPTKKIYQTNTKKNDHLILERLINELKEAEAKRLTKFQDSLEALTTNSCYQFSVTFSTQKIQKDVFEIEQNSLREDY